MVPMKMYGITVHEMTTGEIIGFISVVAVVFGTLAVVFFRARRRSRRP